ncbi:MAG: DUF3857 domain-containing protein [Bacteroidota bacterium]
MSGSFGIMRLLTTFCLCLAIASAYSQGNDFPFGKVTYRELDIKTYDKDSSASAVILNEFGEAYFDEQRDFNLVFTYHATIKVLKQAGVAQADIEIPIYHSGSRKEELISVRASSFSLVNNTITESKLDLKSIYEEDINKYWSQKKFAVPNVSVGSIIEIQYMLVSPFVFNFRNWPFQSAIPKVKSEFWATIPGNYIYNTTLKGYFELSKNENEIIRKCFYNGRADCARYKYAMENIPAFREEDYMTAKSNFLATINYELAEIRHFDGRSEKFTKEWKDAEQELRTNEKFGLQLRRGKDIVDGHVELVLAGETNELAKAVKIYEFVKSWYRWDEVYGMLSEFGIKQAFDSKTGNVGDINLTLIAALKYAGFNVNPVILSTRQNGLPIELHPVLSDFNYVIGRLELNDKIYLLDATDDFLPFGVLPHRCFNGKGRVISEKDSCWMDLKPIEKDRTFTSISLELHNDGDLSGTIKKTYFGYAAIAKRKEMAGFEAKEDLIEMLNGKVTDYQIVDLEITNRDDLSKEYIEVFSIKFEESSHGQAILLNPLRL